MALYSFECGCGNRFNEIRPMSEAGRDCECPVCHEMAKAMVPLIARTPRKWGTSVGRTLDQIQRDEGGNLSDEVKARHTR